MRSFEMADGHPRQTQSHPSLIRPTLFRHPIRNLVATLAAGAVALTAMVASAVPVSAGQREDDLAKALFAAIAIGAVVNAIDRNNDKRRVQTAPVPAPVHQPGFGRGRGVLPQTCAIEISGRDRRATVYPERCLRREGVDGRLPRQCGFDARIYGRTDRVYAENCLLDAGFRLGRGGRNDRWDDHRGGRHDDRDRRDWSRSRY